MKFKFLNESDELWLSSGYVKEPHSEYKLSFYCNAKPLKSELKNLSDPEEIEKAINIYSKSGNYKYAGSENFNGNTFLRFNSIDRYDNKTFWYCRNFSNDTGLEKLKHDLPEGSILVADVGYSMVLYEFYRIEKYQGKSVVLSKLEKISSGDGFKPYVKPGTKPRITEKFRITFPKSSDSCPTVSLGYRSYLYLEPSRLYDKARTYQEDHLD